jgi:ribosome-binding ATPase YchF (GTP1/OBG family)
MILWLYYHNIYSVQCIVPDQKFKYLVECFKPSSIVPAVLKVTDIAGLIKGASEGAGLGNAFLSHIAAVDGIFHLIRAFDSDEVIHVDDSVDPIRDLETIQGELCAKDKGTLENVLEQEQTRVRKEKGIAKAGVVPLSEAFQSAFEKCSKLINDSVPVQTCNDFNYTEIELIKDWGLITTKPQIYVVNLSQKNFIRKGSKWLPKISEWVKTHGGGQIMPVSCDFEQQLYDLKDDKDALKGMYIYIYICYICVRHCMVHVLLLMLLHSLLSCVTFVLSGVSHLHSCGMFLMNSLQRSWPSARKRPRRPDSRVRRLKSRR